MNEEVKAVKSQLRMMSDLRRAFTRQRSEIDKYRSERDRRMGEACGLDEEVVGRAARGLAEYTDMQIMEKYMPSEKSALPPIGKVYLAASPHRRGEMQGVRDKLTECGITVVSRWLDDEPWCQSVVHGQGVAFPEYAARDAEDYTAADTVIWFADAGRMPPTLMFAACHGDKKSVVVIRAGEDSRQCNGAHRFARFYPEFSDFVDAEVPKPEEFKPGDMVRKRYRDGTLSADEYVVLAVFDHPDDKNGRMVTVVDVDDEDLNPGQTRDVDVYWTRNLVRSTPKAEPALYEANMSGESNPQPFIAGVRIESGEFVGRGTDGKLYPMGVERNLGAPNVTKKPEARRFKFERGDQVTAKLLDGSGEEQCYVVQSGFLGEGPDDRQYLVRPWGGRGYLCLPEGRLTRDGSDSGK